MSGVIESAIKAARGFTSGGVPSVAIHLTGPVKSVKALEAEAIRLNPDLMRQVEHFLEKEVGVPLQQGLKILKADAAADSLVMTANGLEGTGREVVIKLTSNMGVYKQMPHLNGNALHIDEPLMAPAVQTTVKSALNGSPVLVRVEPLMEPADKVIERFAGRDAQKVKETFGEAMRLRIRERGLADMDVKANNFAIPRGATPVNSLQELLERDVRVIDLGATMIRSPEVDATLARPGNYKPVFREPASLPKRIDDLYAAPTLPTLGETTAVPATAKGIEAETGVKRK